MLQRSRMLRHPPVDQKPPHQGGAPSSSGNNEPKIKRDSAVPDAATSSGGGTEAAAPDAAPSSSGKNVPKLFEFKFISSDWEPSGLFDDYDLEIRFHIELLVNPESGEFSLPAGPDGHQEVKGWIKWPMIGSTKRSIHTVEEPLVGRVQDGCLRLGYTCRKEESASTTKINIRKIDWSQVPEDNTHVEYELVCFGLPRFLADLGGSLNFDIQWNEDSRLRRRLAFRLYAVISEIRPGQSLNKIVLEDETKTPDWDRLEGLVDRHPKTKRLKNRKGVVLEYRRFLALKLLKKIKASDDDDEGLSYAPCVEVDKVWHLHLVFPELYQQDVLADAKELKVQPFVVPHCPLLGEKFSEASRGTHSVIKDSELEKIVGQKVDMKIWDDYASYDDGDQSEGSSDSERSGDPCDSLLYRDRSRTTRYAHYCC